MKYIATALLCLWMQQANAQIRTIIPAERMERVSQGTTPEGYDIYTAKDGKTVTNITFNLFTLPDNATVENALLRLVLDENVETVRLVGEATYRTDSIAIRNKSNWDYKRGDEILLATNDKRLFAKILNESKASRTITIRISTQQEDKRYKIYNTTRYGTDTDPAKIPRLIVDYRPEIKQVAWAGYLSDAQHTGASSATFPEEDQPTALKSKKIADKQQIKGLVFNKDRLLFTDQPMGSTILHSMDPITGKSMTLHSELDPPIARPVISRDGYYYHVAANNISCIKLDDATRKTVLYMRVNNAPVLGKDGSMYLSTDTFIRAYSPPPLYMPLWRYSVGNTGSNDVQVGPISLSNDDSLAYVIFGKKSNPVYHLVAINTVSKKVDTASLEMRFETDALPVIAVNNSNFVYFINGRTAGNRLYIFDRNIKRKTTVSGYNRISRPVASNNNVYVVADRKLIKIQANRFVDSMDVNISAVDQIATDKDDNIYILSGKIVTLCSFKKGNQRSPVTYDLNNSSEFYNMIVAPDGSLYINTDNDVLAIRPSSFLNQNYTVSDLSLKHGITYRSNNLSIKEGEVIKGSSDNVFVGSTEVHVQKNVTFESGTDNAFESGGTIRIGTEFKVQKGAKLSFKTGY